MWPNSLNIDVSRETAEKLEIYHALLLKWQRAINLVSPGTVNDAWLRHFADSAQIESYVSGSVSRESSTKKCVVVDLGCGAGFPGLVLAMMRPDLEIHLVESDERKCQFLRTVSRETGLNSSGDVIVHNVRIESCVDDIQPDFVTARALASLDVLLEYIEPWSLQNSALQCLFMKGMKADEEVEQARQHYNFDLEKRPSITDPQAALLYLCNITVKR